MTSYSNSSLFIQFSGVPSLLSKSAKILIDSFFIGDPYSSIGAFQRNFIKELVNLDTTNEYTIIASPEYRGKFDNLVHTVYYTGNTNFLSRFHFLSSYIRDNRFDVLLATFNIFPFWVSGPKILLVNHDWSHGRAGDSFMNNVQGSIYAKIHTLSAKKATLNISNSKFTAAETLEFTGHASAVIYHDCDPYYRKEFSDDMLKAPCLPDSDYILYVGRVAPPYKNISSLLTAFMNLDEYRDDLKLVIVSSDDFSAKDRALIGRMGSRLKHLRNVSDLRVKYFLYKHAFVTVYPSLYEGFGLPVLEAQASGSPVIASCYGPLPEVGGDGALYFDGSSNDLLRKILILDERKRRELILKGKNNIRRFSWKRTAVETLKALAFIND